MIFATEDQFSAEFHKQVRNTWPETWRLMFHTPNEGKKSMQEAMKLKAMGVIAGVPDHILLWKLRMYCFELKLPNGTVSQAQKDLHKAWAAQGAVIYICYDLESALIAMELVMTAASIIHPGIFICKQSTIKRQLS